MSDQQRMTDGRRKELQGAYEVLTKYPMKLYTPADRAFMDTWAELHRLEQANARLRQELKDLRDDTRDYEVERARNADKFSREGY